MLPLHLQPESHIPLYVQLRDQLRALVHSGELRTGDRIPASRELAGQLGVHRTTVANAYAELESEGLIQGHVGRGTFICRHAGKQFSPPPRTNGNGHGGDALGIAICRRARRGRPEPPDAGSSGRRNWLRHRAPARGIFPGRRIPALLQFRAAQRRPRSSAVWLNRRIRAAEARADGFLPRAKAWRCAASNC